MLSDVIYVVGCIYVFFVKQKTAYEMRISDWSSDVCSSDLSVRPALLLDLATKESLRVQPREQTDVTEPLPTSNYWHRVASDIRNSLGPDTKIDWTVNQTHGVWVSFEINQDQYCLVFDREKLGLTAGIEWFGWGATALLLALIGAAVSVRCVHRPLG